MKNHQYHIVATIHQDLHPHAQESLNQHALLKVLHVFASGSPVSIVSPNISTAGSTPGVTSPGACKLGTGCPACSIPSSANALCSAASSWETSGVGGTVTGALTTAVGGGSNLRMLVATGTKSSIAQGGTCHLLGLLQLHHPNLGRQLLISVHLVQQEMYDHQLHLVATFHHLFVELYHQQKHHRPRKERMLWQNLDSNTCFLHRISKKNVSVFQNLRDSVI